MKLESMNIHEWIRPSKRGWRKLRQRRDYEAVRQGYNRLKLRADPQDAAFYREVARSLAALEVGAGAKVLDAGCGAGALCRALGEAGFSNVSAFDISDENVAAAARWAQAAFRSSAEEIQAESGTFDLVASINVIEHVMSPALALREFFRVLKPGGLLYLMTDNSWWQTLMVLRRLVTPPWTWYERFPQPIDGDFTTWEMRALLEGAGLEVVGLSGVGGVPFGDRYVAKLIGGPTAEHPRLKHFTTRMAFTCRKPNIPDTRR